MFNRMGAWCASAALVCATISGAQGATLFTYNGFSNTSGLTLVGSAATATTSDGSVLRLTPALNGQAGAAYSTSPVTLGSNATFSTLFHFRFTDPGGIDPADGITFVLAKSTSGLGGAGAGIGYAGVPNSVAIEFDTYNNGAGDGNSSNHVSIDTGGSLTNTDLSNVYGNPSCGFSNGSPAQNPNTADGCMSNGHLWTGLISYDGANLTVSVQDPAEPSAFVAINGFAINIAAILGTNTAFVGFTSATGSGHENHDILDWTFANTAAQISTVPEPAAPLLFGSGLLVVAWLGRKRVRSGWRR